MEKKRLMSKKEEWKYNEVNSNGGDNIINVIRKKGWKNEQILDPIISSFRESSTVYRT